MTTIAASPFNRKSADVILRSADNVNFYVSKEILGVASPFFNDMFSLNQPSFQKDTAPIPEIVPLTENSKTIDALLRLCYPVTDPKLTKLPRVEDILEAAIKYQFDEATTILIQTLETLISERPLEIFAIACRLELEKEAGMAAEAWKRHWLMSSRGDGFLGTLPGASYIPQMSRISSACYLRLLHFVITDDNSHISFTSPGCPFKSPANASSPTTRKDVLQSFKDDLNTFSSSGNTDIIIRSYDRVEFRVHKLVLGLGQGLKILGHPNTTLIVDNQGDLPVHSVDASGEVLTVLLRLCYPGIIMDIQDFSLLSEVLQVAIKHEMKEIPQMLKKQLMNTVDDHPLETYLLATNCGLSDVAEAAARVASGLRLEEQYVRQMEDTSAEALHRLFDYQYRYSTAISQVVTRHAMGASDWKSVGIDSKLNSSNTIPPMVSFALVETELRKARDAAICPSPGIHALYSNGGLYIKVTDEYVLKADDLLQCSKSLEAEIMEARTKVKLEMTAKASST